MPTPPNVVVAVLEDLFFTVKIADAAKRAGMEAVFVKNAEAAIHKLHDRPALMVVDLNCASVDPIELVTRVKASEFRDIPMIGFISHVQVERRQQAVDAGYDKVLARSAFSDNLVQVLLSSAP
jgi:CheY-like chemotaxis protein